jgi:branched-chain amino acid transport system permease protein
MGLPSGTFSQSYAQDMAIVRTKTQWLLLLVLLIIVFTAPLYLSQSLLAIMIVIGITIISVHGLNILTGYCGQISLGHAAFMAVGGYTSGILVAKLGLSFWAALPCAGLAAGIVGLIFGLPSLKIKGFYLIMATVAAQFIIIWVILQLYSITGGATGLSVPRPEIGGFVFESRASYYYLVMAFAVLATFLAKNLVRTRVGRAFIAIRDNDLAAEVMGVNVFRYKLLAFFIGCVFAGVAGALMVHYVTYAFTAQFSFLDSVWYLGMLIAGGMGSTTGAIFGVIFLKVLDYVVTLIGPPISAILPPSLAAQASAALGLITRGLVIILIVIFEPRGLAHRWELVKSYYRLWPFSH